MQYLHIKVTSASLIIDTKVKNVPKNVLNRVEELKEQYPKDKFRVYKGDDIKNPIKFTNASNMLAALCNIRTVPTKPAVLQKIIKKMRELDSNINLQRSQICDEVAKTGYVNYHTYINDNSFVEQIVGDDGDYYNIYKNEYKKSGRELFKGYKTAINSDVKTMETHVFENEDPIKGVYDYQMLLRYFNDDYNHPLYVKIRKFINEILDTDNFQNEYTFIEMAQKIYEKKKSSTEIEQRVDEFAESIKQEWKDVAESIQKTQSSYPIWMYAIFHKGKLTSSNNIYIKKDGKHSATYLRLSRDVDHYRIPVDMELIFKVDDEQFENALRNGRGTATLLDGGICTIEGYTNFEPVVNYENIWTKIK